MAQVQNNAHRLYLAVYDKLNQQSVPLETKHLIELLHKTANPQFIHARYQKQCHTQCHDEVARIRTLIANPTIQKLDAVLRILNPLAARLGTIIAADVKLETTLGVRSTRSQQRVFILLEMNKSYT
jgi:hypothetical protein